MIYWLDLVRESRWIIPPKCASASISRALRLESVSREEFERHSEWQTFGVVRQPFERIKSALFSVCYEGGELPFAERYEKHKDDPHVAPQAPWFAGIRCDELFMLGALPFLWPGLGLPDLPHINAGIHEKHDEGFDWNLIRDRYESDFDLWRLSKS